MRCLVTGATGYVGGRLVPRLLARGYTVRCLTRHATSLRVEAWTGQVEIAEGDAVADRGLDAALAGVDVAYYLIHSLGRRDFEEVDRDGALHFADAARRAGVRRIVYLGGPDPGHTAASAHLRSREEVARILLASGVPTTVLRAAVIIGSGSASFEMLRHLTERLPVMVTPRWVSNRIEPIAIRDVLHYLVASAEAFPDTVNRSFAIGDGAPITYLEMMRRYAAVAGLRPRMIIRVRPLTPALSALWVGLVTPVPNSIARPLVASLIHEAVAHEHDIAAYIPDPPEGLTDFDTAVRLALRRVRDADVETRWSDAAWPGAPTAPLPADARFSAEAASSRAAAETKPAADPLPSDPSWSGGTVYVDTREEPVAAPPERLWRVIEEIGGANGWYSLPLAWAARGWLDRIAGGVGLRRGRRDQKHLYVGEALDFWRVEEIVPGQLLRLRAEMRLPGQAWLELSVTPDGPGRSRYAQRAIFLPKGLPGRAYWAAVTPFHTAVFAGMARNIARTAESGAGRSLTSGR